MGKPIEAGAHQSQGWVKAPPALLPPPWNKPRQTRCIPTSNFQAMGFLWKMCRDPSNPLAKNWPQYALIVLHRLQESCIFAHARQPYLLIGPCTVQPQLSGPRLTGPLNIRTSWRPENILPRMCRRRGQWSFLGVVAVWAMSYRLCRLALAKTGLLEYFSEHCWPWSYCIGSLIG